MKITIYELLGLVKDGKAPKKVRFDNVIWNKVYGENNILYEDEKFVFSDKTHQYYVGDNSNDINTYYNHSLKERLYDFIYLNDEVEILEEEKKIPEKIRHDACWIYDDETNQLEKITLKDDLILNKLDDIIDYLDYLKSKGDE